MPKKMPPYVSMERSRHGQARYYYRYKRGKRVRLPDLYAKDFDEAYRAAHNSEFLNKKPKSTHKEQNSLEWLIKRYMASPAYHELAASTRRDRSRILEKMIDQSGTANCHSIKRRHILEAMDRRRSTPGGANNFIKAARGLFKWAASVEIIDTDPTLGVSKLKLKNKAGIPAWTEEEVASYEATWPLGTNERVWLDVLLYTGLRKGDAVVLGRQHIRDGVATLRTEKTGVEVSFPILAPLQRSLNAGPTGDLHFIVGKSGHPLTKESFGNMFRKACNAAGVSKSAHGLRKIATARAAEAGATDSQLKAMFGWSTSDMAALYTRTANRRKLALDGWGELHDLKPSSPAP